MSSPFNNSVRCLYVNDNHVAVELSDGSLKLYKHQKDDTSSDQRARVVVNNGRKFEPSSPVTPTITSTVQSMSPEEKAVVAKLLSVANENQADPNQVIAELSYALGKVMP